MDASSRKAWERRPDESSKSYNAFLEYLKMPIRDIDIPSNSRTLANLSQKLGYKVKEGKAASTIEQWSSKYDWIERARLHDNHNAELTIKVQDASLKEFQQDIIERRTFQSALLNSVLEQQIQDVMKRQATSYPVDALELVRLTTAAKNLDDLERRIAGLPTNHTTEKVDDEQTNETRIFTIGG